LTSGDGDKTYQEETIKEPMLREDSVRSHFGRDQLQICAAGLELLKK
jgi:hypothetical protein